MPSQRVLNEIENLKAKKIRQAAQVAFDSLADEWPVWSGWSAAHNLVAFGDPQEAIAGQFFDNPNPIEGAWVSLASVNAVEQEIKISQGIPRTKPDEVWIVNPVPYAPNVSFTPGRGIQIYQTAANVAARRI